MRRSDAASAPVASTYDDLERLMYADEPINFSIVGEPAKPFHSAFTFPTAAEVVDALRKDPDTRILPGRPPSDGATVVRTLDTRDGTSHLTATMRRLPNGSAQHRLRRRSRSPSHSHTFSSRVSFARAVYLRVLIRTCSSRGRKASPMPLRLMLLTVHLYQRCQGCRRLSSRRIARHRVANRGHKSASAATAPRGRCTTAASGASTARALPFQKRLSRRRTCSR